MSSRRSDWWTAGRRHAWSDLRDRVSAGGWVGCSRMGEAGTPLSLAPVDAKESRSAPWRLARKHRRWRSRPPVLAAVVWSAEARNHRTGAAVAEAAASTGGNSFRGPGPIFGAPGVSQALGHGPVDAASALASAVGATRWKRGGAAEKTPGGGRPRYAALPLMFGAQKAN